MSASGDRQLIYHCACGAHLNLPREAVGRKIRCQMCGAIAVAPPPTRTDEPAPKAAAASRPVRRAKPHAQSSPPATASEDSPPIRVECLCGAKLKIAAALAGRDVRCPKCSRSMAVPSLEPISADRPIEFCPPEALLYDFAKTEASAPSAARREPVSEPPPPPVLNGPTCPSCGTRFPKGAKICVDCGIDIKTGRSLITSQEDNLDDIYIATENTLRVVSIILWFGIFPFASEAFGTAKPYVVRGIALFTILTSIAFWVASCDSARQLMLWSGDPKVEPDLGPLTPPGEKLPPEIAEALRQFETERTGHFEPYQLITHAFLHADLLHLAGNLLFLIVFGSRVNALLGNIFTLPLYLLFAVAAALGHMASVAHEPLGGMLGASGAIMGMAGMYLVFFPAHNVHVAAWKRWGWIYGFHLSYKLFTVSGFWVVAFYISLDILATLLGAKGGVAHWAHLGGFIAGAVTAVILLVTRLVNGRGTDLISIVLGRHAWMLVGRPRRARLDNDATADNDA